MFEGPLRLQHDAPYANHLRNTPFYTYQHIADGQNQAYATRAVNTRRVSITRNIGKWQGLDFETLEP